MTARSIFPDTRRRPVRIAVALCIVMVAVLLAVGCVGGDCPSPKYVPVITKISSDGSPVWTTMIDTGVDNRANDMIVTPDGNIVIAGSEATKTGSCSKDIRPNIIRLSGNGDVLWNRTFDNNGKSALAVTGNQDNAVVTIFSSGDINKLDRKGNLLWNKKTGFISDSWSATNTRDGGYFFGGSYYLKTDGDGNIVWQKNLLNNSRSLYFRIPVIETNESQYLAGNFIKSWDHEDIVSVARIDADGAFDVSPGLTSYGALVDFPFFPVQEGTLAFFLNGQNSTHPVRVVALDPEGRITTEKELQASAAVIPTNDHGYFSADTDNVRLHLVKLDPDGIIEWDKKLSLDFTQGPNNPVIKVVQSPDGSFIVLYSKTEQINLSN